MFAGLVHVIRRIRKMSQKYLKMDGRIEKKYWMSGAQLMTLAGLAVLWQPLAV